MIIFGTRSMQSVRSTGIFNCPRCGRSKPYEHKSVNQWFTLYFIPVIPMGSKGTLRAVQPMRRDLGEEVLSYDPEAETRQLYLKLRGLLTLVALADGTPRPRRDRRHRRRRTWRRPAGRCRPATSKATCRQASAGKVPLGPYARQLGPQLNYQGKALFMRAAFRVLCAKGPPRSDASAVIAEIAQTMQLSADKVKQILG